MGLFDGLFGRDRKPSASAEPADSKPDRPSTRENIFTGRGWLRGLNKLGPADKMRVREDFVTVVGEELGTGSVVSDTNDERAEWRGTCDGVPTRVWFDGLRLGGDLKITNPHGDMDIEWRANYVGTPGPGTAWDEDDQIRVFVGRGVCLETLASMMPEQIAAFDSMPEPERSRLIEAIHAEAVYRTTVREDRIRFLLDRDVTGQPEPAGSLVRVTRAMAAAAAAWAKVPVDPRRDDDDESPLETSERVTCSYCTATYLLDASFKCPNCGAPHQR